VCVKGEKNEDEGVYKDDEEEEEEESEAEAEEEAEEEEEDVDEPMLNLTVDFDAVEGVMVDSCLLVKTSVVCLVALDFLSVASRSLIFCFFIMATPIEQDSFSSVARAPVQTDVSN
jgi:hypothetical protein